MNTDTDILLSQFGNILHVRPEQVAYQVMMLPDTQYNMRFAQLSLELNVDVNTLKQQFVEVAMTQLVNKQTRYLPEADSQESAGKKKVRQTYQRAIKQEYQQFQKLYAEKLFQVLRSADNTAVFTRQRALQPGKRTPRQPRTEDLLVQPPGPGPLQDREAAPRVLPEVLPARALRQPDRRPGQRTPARDDREPARGQPHRHRQPVPGGVCEQELLQAQHRHVRHQPEEKVILVLIIVSLEISQKISLDVVWINKSSIMISKIFSLSCWQQYTDIFGFVAYLIGLSRR
ncbi:Hypothetical_protein [Hexamita inflata]|uniref:Hypothetical_protein n=1 Tax=Hexamita inflata TaxID=28002 RepID=A0AA86UGC8_9EUKA|nr:Hypothetical protein HINF_LOCUS44715 [Hexamita inflata]